MLGSTIFRLRTCHDVDQPTIDGHGLPQGLRHLHEDLRKGKRLRRGDLQGGRVSA
jgi:hypothetical protein